MHEACRRALEAEAINVGLIDRMLTRGLDGQPATPAAQVGGPRAVLSVTARTHRQEALMNPASRAFSSLRTRAASGCSATKVGTFFA